MESKKKIKMWDLVFMNVSACYGIRWLAKSTAANFGLGLGAIPLWVLFAIIYFIPQALMAAEFACKYTNDGGIYEWVKRSFGEKWGFLVSWLNWTSKVIWYSSILTFFAIDVAYSLGMETLSTNKIYTLILSLVIFWVLSLVSIKGMGKAKILTNLGAFGTIIPTAYIIIMAFLSVMVFKTSPSASTYNLQTLTPKLDADSLVAISSLMFAFSGTEIAANFINEMDNPKRDFPKAIGISAAIIAVMYVIGSIAITMIMPSDKITASTGIFDAIKYVSVSLGIPAIVPQLLALGIALSILGGLIITIVSPTKMLFGTSPKGMFPDWLTQTNKVHIPTKSVLFQAVLVSIIIISTSLLPSVDAIYNILVTMSAISALLPYFMMYMSYIKMKRERIPQSGYVMTKNVKAAIGIGVFIVAVSVVGIVLTAVPVMSTLSENIVYEIEIVGGGILMIVSGLLLWNRYKRKNSKADENV